MPPARFKAGDRVKLRVTTSSEQGDTAAVLLEGSCGTIWMTLNSAPDTYFVQFDDVLHARLITARDLERIG